MKVEINIWRHAYNKMMVTSREEEMVKELLMQKVQMLEDLVEQKREKYKWVYDDVREAGLLMYKV